MKEWSGKKKVIVGLLVLLGLGLVMPWPVYQQRCDKFWGGETVCVPDELYQPWFWRGPVLWVIFNRIMIGEVNTIDDVYSPSH